MASQDDGISAADIAKTLQLKTKQFRGTNSAADTRKIIYLCLLFWDELSLHIRALVPWLTKEVDNEAVAVAVDVGGRVGLELDGDVRSGGVELKSGL